MCRLRANFGRLAHSMQNARSGRREEIEAAPVMGWPLDLVILSRRRRISVRGEYEVIGIHAGAWCSPLPADWDLTGLPLLTVLTEILRCAQDDGGRREGNPVTQAPFSEGSCLIGLRNTERFWGDCQLAAFPPTGIYYRLSHMLRVSRFFTPFRMVGRPNKRKAL